jgi:hypothetical protein
MDAEEIQSKTQLIQENVEIKQKPPSIQEKASIIQSKYLKFLLLNF